MYDRFKSANNPAWLGSQGKSETYSRGCLQSRREKRLDENIKRMLESFEESDDVWKVGSKSRNCMNQRRANR